MKKRVSIIIVSIMALVLSLVAITPAQSVVEITFGTTSSKSGFYPFIAAHATVVNKNLKDIHMTAIECPGAAGENIERLRMEQIDMGMSGVAISARSYSGIGEYEGKANPHLRLIATHTSLPFTFFVTKKSGVKSVYELEGKPFGTSFPHGITGRKAHKFFDGLGIKPKYFEAGMGANVAAVKDGRIIGFVKAGSPDSTVLDIATTIPITILSISENDLKKAMAKYPHYIAYTDIIPAGAYPGQDKDVLTYPMLGAWATTDKLSPEVGYKMVKTWYQNRKELAAMYAAANRERGTLGFPKLTVDTSLIPLHVGAIKFYKELGLSIPTKLIPPEMK